MVEALRKIGQYEVLNQIGRGGAARIYLARQPGLGREVALKELDLRVDEPEAADRFVHEAQMTGSLSHPNIVQVYDFFEHHGIPYIAMEHLERGSLRPLVGHLTLAQIAGVIEGMLAGLAHGERSGIVHRDIKPENVLVTREGGVKVSDYGIAKALTATTHFRTSVGTVLGTPLYMAPEQAKGEELGPWTDLYATGVIAYELMVGRVPFFAESPWAVLAAHSDQPVPPPLDHNPELDPMLARWLEELLAKAPEERPRGAQEAWQSLEEIVVNALGPYWRREARLIGGEMTRAPAKPLTPAPFAPEPEPVRPDDARSEPAAGDLVRGGRETHDVRDFASEVDRFTKILEQDPRSVDALIGRGEVNLKLHQANAAHADFARALHVDPDSVGALVGRARANAELWRIDESLADAERALALDPMSANAHLARGTAFASTMNVDDTQKALASFERALQIDPESVEALVGRSDVLSLVGQYEPAMEDAERALKLDPDSPQALARHAELLSNLGRTKEALADSEQALQIDPKSLEGLAARGWIHVDAQRHARAADDFARILELYPENPLSLVLQGFLHIAREEFGEAVASFSRAAPHLPRSGMLLAFRGMSNFSLGHYEAALRDLERAYGVDPGLDTFAAAHGFGELREIYASAYISLGRFEEAVREFDQSLAAQPRSVSALVGRSRALLRLERYDAALRDISRALEIDPESEEAQSARNDASGVIGQTAPEALPPTLRQEVEEARARNQQLVSTSPFENGLYPDQREALLGRLTGSEQLLWLCRCSRSTDVFRSVALLITTEKLLWCHQTALGSAKPGWATWPAVANVEKISGGFSVTTSGGGKIGFNQFASGIDLTGEGHQLDADQLHALVNDLAGGSH